MVGYGTLWHFIWRLLVARSRVVMRLRTKLASPFMIFSYGLPWSASFCERVARRKHEGRGVSAQRSAQVIISTTSGSTHFVRVALYECRSRTACNLASCAALRQVLRQPNLQSAAWHYTGKPFCFVEWGNEYPRYAKKNAPWIRADRKISPLKTQKREEKKNNGRAKLLAKVFFEKPSIDGWHGPESLRIDQLVCASIVDLLDDVGSFPLRLELPLRLVCDDDGPP